MIERLYVHNFRCFENFTLDLTGRPSALMIGRNGSGKSTVRHALSLLQGIARGAHRTAGLVTMSDFTRHRTDQPMRFEIEIALSGKRYRYALAFDWPPHFREARILEETLWRDGTIVFSRKHAEIRLSDGVVFHLDWHVFALPVINEPPGETAISEFKQFLSSMILIAPIPSRMTGQSEAPAEELLDDASNYASCLRMRLGQKPAAYAVFHSYVKTVLPEFSAIENRGRADGGSQLVISFESESPVRRLSLDFDAMSDGEKSFFLSAFLLASNSVSPVFGLWDEPDNHLSLSETRHFVTELRKLGHRSGQFLTTSHHPETIRTFSDETTFVFSRKSHLDPTVVRPLSELGYEGDLIHALIRDEIIG